MNTWQVVITAVSGLLGASGFGIIVKAFADRRRVKVDAADVLNDSTLEWARDLKADAREARQEAREARQEAAEARREASLASRQVAILAQQLRELHAAILEPGITVTRLRDLVVAQNGRP